MRNAKLWSYGAVGVEFREAPEAAVPWDVADTKELEQAHELQPRVG